MQTGPLHFGWGTVALAPDQRLAIAGVGAEPGRSLQLMNWPQLTLKSSIPLGAGGLRNLSVFPDGETLFTFGSDRKLNIWSIATGENKFSYQFDEPHGGIASLGPDGRTVVSCGAYAWLEVDGIIRIATQNEIERQDKSVQIWQLQTSG